MTYRRDQLRDMAQHALAARDADDSRWLMLVLRLSLFYGLDPNEVERQIEGLAA